MSDTEEQHERKRMRDDDEQSGDEAASVAADVHAAKKQRARKNQSARAAERAQKKNLKNGGMSTSPDQQNSEPTGEDALCEVYQLEPTDGAYAESAKSLGVWFPGGKVISLFDIRSLKITTEWQNNEQYQFLIMIYIPTNSKSMRPTSNVRVNFNSKEHAYTALADLIQKLRNFSASAPGDKNSEYSPVRSPLPNEWYRGASKFYVFDKFVWAFSECCSLSGLIICESHDSFQFSTGNMRVEEDEDKEDSESRGLSAYFHADIILRAPANTLEGLSHHKKADFSVRSMMLASREEAKQEFIKFLQFVCACPTDVPPRVEAAQSC